MKVRLIVISIILLMTSCAQQRSPSGGPRDTEPPKVLMANPLPMSTDFKAKRIEILFDEYVQLNGVRDQVLISPPLIDEPEISLKNSKRLIIDLGDQPLTKNTTYTVNLGEAIVDNNERNVLLENVYLFSTGSFIDSLQISGQILRAVYNDPCEFCMAMLFKGDVPDSSIIGNRPLYVAKADESGKFLLSNLASGDYRLLAFDDLNSDLRIDENESFGFLDSLVKPSVLDSLGTEVRISKALSSEPIISFSEWALDGSYLTLSVQGLDSLSDFRGTASQNVLFTENLDNVGDSVRLWFSPLLDEEDELIIDFNDGSDTLRIGRVSEKDMEYQIQAIADLPNQEAEMDIQFSSPLSSLNSDLIQILRDSIPLDFTITQELPSLRFSVNTEWQPGNYQLSLFPGAFIYIYGIDND
ncbi:MAG: hypothetical protein HKO93_04575, partial [Flavobacteriales bacterium]|nr:hypothetical protein [Flavobacteriales bacterium]